MRVVSANPLHNQKLLALGERGYQFGADARGWVAQLLQRDPRKRLGMVSCLCGSGGGVPNQGRDPIANLGVAQTEWEFETRAGYDISAGFTRPGGSTVAAVPQETPRTGEGAVSVFVCWGGGTPLLFGLHTEALKGG
jgi:hypothetical protein